MVQAGPAPSSQFQLQLPFAPPPFPAFPQRAMKALINFPNAARIKWPRFQMQISFSELPLPTLSLGLSKVAIGKFKSHFTIGLNLNSNAVLPLGHKMLCPTVCASVCECVCLCESNSSCFAQRLEKCFSYLENLHMWRIV